MAENQTKSEAPRLTEIAAQIMTGLLASGDYTNSPERYKAGSSWGGGEPRATVRGEAMVDAIQIAQALISLTQKQGQTPIQPEQQAPTLQPTSR